jgi:hypothetical protein
MDHPVQVGDLLVGVGEQREVERVALGLLDVVRPALVRVERIDRETRPSSVVQTGVKSLG